MIFKAKYPPNFTQISPKLPHLFISFFALCVYRARKAIEPGHRLLVTLRYMATGETYRGSMRYNHVMPHNTISVIIREVVVAIYNEYRDEVWTMPASAEEWKEVSDGFSSRWNFHHCVGAIDGKHVEIVKPKKSGDLYFNYKGWHSIVMMAMVDANYVFRWCSVGHPGKSSDAGIFNRSTLKTAFERGTLHLPAADPLPHDDRNTGYFIVGDEAFPLHPWLMKKYPKRNITHAERIFNYRCSRARLVVENSFGILANRWRCLTTMMLHPPETVTNIVMACLTLHNVIRKRMPLVPGEVDDVNDEGNLIRGLWRHGRQLTDGQRRQGNQNMRQAKIMRDYLKDYYNSPAGAVAWQERHVALNRFHHPRQRDPQPRR